MVSYSNVQLISKVYSGNHYSIYSISYQCFQVIRIEQIQPIKNESILEVTIGGWEIPNTKAGSLCVWVLTSNEKVMISE